MARTSKTPARTANETAPTDPPPVDEEHVAEIASIGCTREEAAAWFGVSPAELGRRLREPALEEAWAQGEARGRVRLRRAQFDLAERSYSMAAMLGRLMLDQGGETAGATPKKVTLIVDTGIDRGRNG